MVDYLRIMPPLPPSISIREAVGDRKVITMDECARLIAEHFNPDDTLHMMTTFNIWMQVEPETAICMMETSEDNVNINIQHGLLMRGWSVWLY